MAEFVEKDTVKEYLKRVIFGADQKIDRWVDDMPAADVRPVVRGGGGLKQGVRGLLRVVTPYGNVLNAERECTFTAWSMVLMARMSQTVNG